MTTIESERVSEIPQAISELPNPRKIMLALLRTDPSTQARSEINASVVTEYADEIEVGAKFPRPVVFYDGELYRVADGFHRVAAYRQLQYVEIECDVHKGTERDAILYAVRANAVHGLRRTNADKRRAVEILLADEEWSRNSARWIADACGVSHPFVGDIRNELVSVTSSDKRVGRDGKTRKLPESSTSNDEVQVGDRSECVPEVQTNDQPKKSPPTVAKSEVELAADLQAVCGQLNEVSQSIKMAYEADPSKLFFKSAIDDAAEAMRKIASAICRFEPGGGR